MSVAMLPSYVFLDLETTGATPLKDRITEIALIRFENGIEVSRWQTLVNPETTIPDFIQQLTGITNAMVANAPSFKQVAGELLDYLEDTVLCAHNVRFDHGFLKSEFKRIGITLRQKVLCTVKLSRKLYPQHRSHALDAIISRHQLTCQARHRAMGDVEMMVGFLKSATQELGISKIRETAEQLLKGAKSLPSGIDAVQVDDIPETPGVYLFFGESKNLPLYIGKSINIRERVLSHFRSDHSSTKEMRISQEITHIEWIETAGEFSALLLESKLIKEHQPIYNRQLRRERQLCSWRIALDANQRPLVSLVQEDEIQPETLGQLFGTFRSKRQAIEVLRNIADQHQLCPRLLALEAGKGACFAHQLMRCNGVCAQKESAELHYIRLQQAMVAHRLKTWPFKGKIGIYEQHPFNEKAEMHVFEHWVHIGSVKDEAEMNELIDIDKSELIFDLDTYKLLIKELNKPRVKLVEMH
jgi:DNA polymerase-3 subunit epsilon